MQVQLICIFYLWVDFCERVKNTDNVIRGIYKIIEFVSRPITE